MLCLSHQWQKPMYMYHGNKSPTSIDNFGMAPNWFGSMISGTARPTGEKIVLAVLAYRGRIDLASQFW